MDLDVTRNSPRNFWLYVAGVTALLAAAAAPAVTWAAGFHPVTGVMAAGALLVVAGFAYAPSCLDMTGWTLTVMAMVPAGVAVMAATPVLYALWVAFVGPHVVVTIK